MISQEVIEIVRAAIEKCDGNCADAIRFLVDRDDDPSINKRFCDIGSVGRTVWPDPDSIEAVRVLGIEEAVLTYRCESRKCRAKIKRPGYREAIEWMVYNDDTEWVDGDSENGSGSISVTGAMVRDLYGVDDARLRADIKRGLDKREKDRK